MSTTTTVTTTAPKGAEEQRLAEDTQRKQNWKRWGPYLAERQWGTVREDYSPDGTCWEYFPHDHARSRAYRWGEDGLLGITDREGRLCFALSLWNGRDPILKERLFGLTGPEGNHGEDVKEAYYYLDATPTSSYLRALYKYPQRAYPYQQLLEENRRRGRDSGEFEIADTGAFDDDRYFDVFTEYAKESPNDVLIRITVSNRGPEPSRVTLLPTLWFRNTWSWGREGEEGYGPRPSIRRLGPSSLLAEHASLGAFLLSAEPGHGRADPRSLFTENETNVERLYGAPNPTPYVKDAFHQRVVLGRDDATNPEERGTKAAFLYDLEVPAGGSISVRLRLSAQEEAPEKPFGVDFDRVFAARSSEADAFYAARLPAGATEDEARVIRQGYAGLLWSRQFYYYVVRDWLAGDPAQPAPPGQRIDGRNADWGHMYNRDIISMPDKWEYPWYAAWDLAFHMIPFARVDPDFAKQQLLLFLREWYMHPNGQIPAYEFAFGDVNPPVHAWAAWRVYKMTGARGERDRAFLARVFQKLLLNFTWWVNRKDPDGHHLFSGGFLGLDNIGVFDRSQALPTGGHLEQADGTAWMAFYCLTMLSMALELAAEDPVYEDVASKFFEHFVAITDAINTLGGTGLWDEEDGFFYDQLHANGSSTPLRVRSLVGLLPLIACEVIEQEVIDRLPSFRKRMEWFLRERPDLAARISCMNARACSTGHTRRLLAVPSRERLEGLLRYLLDPSEFLSEYGIRSVSAYHRDHPYVCSAAGMDHRVDYVPGESTSGLFGGNSNWRGPIWFPLNFLIVEALERLHHFYEGSLTVEHPFGSNRRTDLAGVASDLYRRLSSIFVGDEDGRRACHGQDARYASDPHWRELVLFHEYFHGDTGRGLGASHQTGWTALAVRCVEDTATRRTSAAPPRARPRKKAQPSATRRRRAPR